MTWIYLYYIQRIKRLCIYCPSIILCLCLPFNRYIFVAHTPCCMCYAPINICGVYKYCVPNIELSKVLQVSGISSPGYNTLGIHTLTHLHAGYICTPDVTGCTHARTPPSLNMYKHYTKISRVTYLN